MAVGNGTTFTNHSFLVTTVLPSAVKETKNNFKFSLNIKSEKFQHFEFPLTALRIVVLPAVIATGC